GRVGRDDPEPGDTLAHRGAPRGDHHALVEQHRDGVERRHQKHDPPHVRVRGDHRELQDHHDDPEGETNDETVDEAGEETTAHGAQHQRSRVRELDLCTRHDDACLPGEGRCAHGRLTGKSSRHAVRLSRLLREATGRWERLLREATGRRRLSERLLDLLTLLTLLSERLLARLCLLTERLLRGLCWLTEARGLLTERLLAVGISHMALPQGGDGRARDYLITQKPSRRSCFGSRCQSLATLTCRSRYTLLPSNASICRRARAPTSLSRLPR